MKSNHAIHSVQLHETKIFRLLSLYGLQQYSRQFIERGFQPPSSKLSKLSPQQFQLLLLDMKISPGHCLKMRSMVNDLKEQFRAAQINKNGKPGKLPSLQRQKQKPSFQRRVISIGKPNKNLEEKKGREESMIRLRKIQTQSRKLSRFTKINSSRKNCFSLRTFSLNHAQIHSLQHGLKSEAIGRGVAGVLHEWIKQQFGHPLKTEQFQLQGTKQSLGSLTSQGWQMMASYSSITFQQDVPLDHKIFEEEFISAHNLVKPDRLTLENYILNIQTTAKVIPQALVLALVYIARFLALKSISITNINYRKLVLTSVLLASKVWDDLSWDTGCFLRAFPGLSEGLGDMQRMMLVSLGYRVSVQRGEYLKFELKCNTSRKRSKPGNKSKFKGRDNSL